MRFLLLCFLVAFNSSIYAQLVSKHQVEKVSNHFIQSKAIFKGYSISSIDEENLSADLKIFRVLLNPTGYIIVSDRLTLPPVIAYSNKNGLSQNNPLFSLLTVDLEQRIAIKAYEPSSDLWRSYAENNSKQQYSTEEQWPKAGTTSTGGWIETRWNQDAPYNSQCPMDLATKQRSLTGCPATAMAQIVFFHGTINSTQFTNADDYCHNYGSNSYRVDDDYEKYGFPCFDSLNVYLNRVQTLMDDNSTETDFIKSTLSFACGVAAKQVYGSQGSGTFSVSQAFQAYRRFGFDKAELFTQANASFWELMVANIKEGLPVHLAVVDQSWSSGHNLVVDGYSSDNFFHLNFGWGGNSDGWYLLPSQIPYGLSVVEGAVMNINKQPQTSNDPVSGDFSLNVFPNPASSSIYIEPYLSGLYDVCIYDISGKLVLKNRIELPEQISLSNLSNGLYLLSIGKDGRFVRKSFVVSR